MSEVVRVGVIGTGFGAQVVAPAFRAAEGCEVVDVVTPRDDAGVQALCGRDDVDLISIHSPPFLHLPHVKLAIEAGHAVLCDKPFGRTAEESEEMVELAEQAGVLNLLNFERRFDPGRERLRDLLAEGAIGTPYHFQYVRHIAFPGRPYGWLCDKELGGGWLAGQGSHLVDMTHWLFGEVVEAHSVLRAGQPERPDGDGVMHRCTAEDGFVATMRTAQGLTAVVDCSLESPVSTPETTLVFGTTGLLDLDETGVTLRTPGGDEKSFPVDLEGKGALVLAMERWASYACDAVRTGTVVPGGPTFRDGLACARVMDQMGRLRAVGEA